MADDAELRRAFEYPYRRPPGSYTLDVATGAVGALSPFDPADRTPVLAIGSNAAPEQLVRKFASDAIADAGSIPVTTARLLDHDVVFAARLSAYGACPATVAPCRGAVARVHVTWLTAAQLERLDSSERVHGSPPAYRRLGVPDGGVELDGVSGGSGDLDDPPVVWAYEAVAGALRVDPTPWALGAILADHRVWPALGQLEVLARLAQILGVADAATLARTAAADAATRGRWNAELSRYA